jgi:integrase
MRLNKLTHQKISRAGPGRYGDGGGLALLVSKSPDGSLNRKWIFRFTWRGKVTEHGLGGYGTTLTEARAKAAEARRMVRNGVNPIAAKKAVREHKATPTFGKCAMALIAAKQSEWRSDVHRKQWVTTLQTHAAPIWNTPVDQIDTAAVLGVLQPVWATIPETASRLRGRIEAVIDAARAKGFIGANEANPARWKGHLDHLLARRTQLSRGHHAAIDYRDVPAFLATISQVATVPAMALQFLILTASRAGEVLGAKWAEITGNVWTIHASRMKSGREHRVPLPERAMEIISKLAETRHSHFVFPGRYGRLSRSAMTVLVPTGFTLHGFRSSFRDWAGEETNFPRELAETCLAHSYGDATERAYRRGDALEKRRKLMDDWAAYCWQRHFGNVIKLL